MITNLIATIIILVVTNWTDVYEQKQVADPALKSELGFYAVYRFHYENTDKYLGKDGTVIRVTEIKFDYEGKPQVHQIKEPLEKIIMRCHDQAPVRIWDTPIIEKLNEGKEIISLTNGFLTGLRSISVIVTNNLIKVKPE